MAKGSTSSAAGQARAMKNWGLKAKTTKGGKIARGSKVSGGRNG